MPLLQIGLENDRTSLIFLRCSFRGDLRQVLNGTDAVMAVDQRIQRPNYSIIVQAATVSQHNRTLVGKETVRIHDEGNDRTI